MRTYREATRVSAPCGWIRHPQFRFNDLVVLPPVKGEPRHGRVSVVLPVNDAGTQRYWVNDSKGHIAVWDEIELAPLPADEAARALTRRNGRA